MRKSNKMRDFHLSPGSKVLNAAPELEAANLLPTQARQRLGERWNEDNREAISEYNSRIACEGLPLAKYRTF